MTARVCTMRATAKARKRRSSSRLDLRPDFLARASAAVQKRRALLVDLPGHGQSEKPDVAYTQERFARAIEPVMRHADVERAVLLGHSMGGP
ncbi:MAG: hypothetical protein DMG58_14015 [Acidobacteria bacterium]|nr:MAG: hypothetical protein DMG58_14015 [Acidobacteriota bacterium]